MLPLLYVVSSGPTMTLLWTVRYNRTVDGWGRSRVNEVHEAGTVWPRIYRPLSWASNHWWGEWLDDYWRLFPVVRHKTPAPPVNPLTPDRLRRTLAAPFRSRFKARRPANAGDRR